MNRQTDIYQVLSSLRWLTLIFMLLFTACAASPSPPSSPPPQAAITPRPTATVVPIAETPGACHPTTITSNKTTGFPEALAKASGGTLWALFFFDPATIHVKQELKIVWRMTGTGDFHIVGQSTTGQQVKPVWGPEAHGSSNWDRPGYEWGTGFSFSSPGCWTLRATRDNVTGELGLLVHR